MRFFPRNLIGQAGVTLAVVSVGNIVVFTVIDFISSEKVTAWKGKRLASNVRPPAAAVSAAARRAWSKSGAGVCG